MSEALLTESIDAYRKLRDSFTWDIPVGFNFARDIVDRYGQDSKRSAVLYRDSKGYESRITYAQMSADIRRFAGLLEGLGLGARERLMVLLPRVPEWQIATLGSLLAGIIVVPTSIGMLSARDVLYRLNHSEASAIVATAEAAAALDKLRPEMPGVKHFLAVARGNEQIPPGWIDFGQAVATASPSAGRETLASDAALVFYTSGTTGPSKAVLHNHTYAYAGGRHAALWQGIREHDRFWPTTGWAKAAFAPWSVGAEIVIVDSPFTPAEEIALLESLRPQVFCAPPTQYRLMVKHGLRNINVPELRECVAAGEPLNPEVIRAWRAATGITVRDGYGQSEAGLLVANLVGIAERQGSMGLPVPGHSVAVIDDAAHELNPGEVGDIAVRYPAPGLFIEYLKNPSATGKCFRGEWYLTGDRGYYDADGYFWFVGRGDDVILSGPNRIGPFDVESLLVEHPAVVEAAAVAQPDADLGHSIRAFVVLRPGTNADGIVESLRARFSQPGDEHKLPADFEFVPELPKTATGKIKRAELRARAASENSEKIVK